MASSAVSTAVEARVAAGWTRAPIVDPNKGDEVPSDNSAFLTITYPVADEQQISVGAPGSNVFRETGAFRFVLAVPSQTPLGTYLGWMDELRGLFRSASFAGVETWSAPPVTIDDRNDSGGYFNLSFSVPYQFDTFA